MQFKNIESPKVSILIANYNSASYLVRCIKSIENQNYKKKEIIVVDDQSSDSSLSILKKFKNKITLVKNKEKKYNVGSYDQINAYKIALYKSSGEIIFFLDSDDFFKNNKIQEIVKYFIKNKYQNIVMDRPIIFFNSKNKFKLKKKNRSTFFIPWPRFSPQSCISIRRNYLLEIYNLISVKKFPTIWLDFRIIIFTFLKYKNINFINKFLTFYQKSDNSASSIYKLFTKNWWIRRQEAHNYFNYINIKINNKKSYSIDLIITKFIYHFFAK
jgi:glycosyltransferase involved in cell wall biosynthesis